MKDIIKTHVLTILCVISIVAMFLPFAIISVDMEVMGVSSGASSSVTGFTAAKEGIWGFALIIGPVLLIAMNYVNQLGKYKGLLAIAVPVICIAVGIIVMIQAKSIGAKAMGYSSGGMVNVDIKTSLGIGCIIAMLSYIGTAVAGAVTYHNFTLDKAGLERMKQEGTQFLQSARTSITETAQNVSVAVQSAASKAETTTDAPEPETKSTADTSKARPVTKKQTNLNRTEEVLTMIEKLSQMKDAGILTEEEFSEKKKQLLSEI